MVSNAAKTEGADFALIPIWRNREVVAYAIVDRADFARLSQHEWFANGTSATHIYAVRRKRIEGRQVAILMHREVLGLPHGVGAAIMCDHINHDTLDNRSANLRAVTPAENSANARPGRRKPCRPKPDILERARGRSLVTAVYAAALAGKGATTVWRLLETDPIWKSCIAFRAGNRAYLSTSRLAQSGLIGAAS